MLRIIREVGKSTPKAGFELTPEQVERLKTVGQVALVVAAVAGTLAITAIAPNIFMALDKIFGKKQYGTRKDTLARRQEQLAKSFYYMRQQGYINIEKRGGMLIVHPTEKGLKRLARLRYDSLVVKKPKNWSGTWWIVLADIPSTFRSAANNFQKKLKQMDFYPLQRTVWVHPFDPREEIEDVAAHYRVSAFVTTMEVKRIDDSDQQIFEKYFRRKNLI